MGHAGNSDSGLPRVVTDEELESIRTAPKSWHLGIDDLMDQSKVVRSRVKGEVNRRRSCDLDCAQCAIRLTIRISVKDPMDFSLLLLAEIDGIRRCVCRIDSRGTHPMDLLRLPPAEPPHMHLMKEMYQMAGLKDDIWAEHVDVGSFDDAMRLLITFYNINDIDMGNKGLRG